MQKNTTFPKNIFPSDLNYQLSSRDLKSVVELVLVRRLPSPLDQYAVVWTHAAVHHANVVGDLKLNGLESERDHTGSNLVKEYG